MSYLSDSDNDFPEMSPLFQEVAEQLLNTQYSTPLPPSSGVVREATILPEEQQLFIIIDSYLQYVDDTCTSTELIVRMWPGQGHEERFVHLRDEWQNSLLSRGDPAFVIGEWVLKDDPFGMGGKKYSMVIDEMKGYFVLLPQILIQGTKLAASQNCNRKAYLIDLLPQGHTDLKMLKGTIIHELIQIILLEGPIENLEARIDNLLETEKLSLYFIGKDKKSFIEEIKSSLDVIYRIGENVKSEFNDKNFNINGNGQIYENIQALPPYGCKTVKEEENIWSFQWGLKGKIDVTLQSGDYLFPLEIKSGNSFRGVSPRDSHILQLAAYIFMVKEKYKEKSGNAGALFYSSDSVSFNILPSHRELFHIMMKRNKLAHAIAHGTIPETTHSERDCKYCENAILACAFLETGETKKSPISRFLKTKLSYLPEEHHIEFYRNFEQNLLEEMQLSQNAQMMIWLTDLKTRIKLGRAINKLKVEEGIYRELNFVAKSGKLSKFSGSKTSFVMITRNGNPPVVGRGYITSICLETNKISVEMIESSLEIGEENICIDIWESSTGVDICRTNLLSLFASDNVDSIRLRELIVDSKPPVFDHFNKFVSLETQLNTNVDQTLAINAALASKDYMLLLGMPGTGKTTTVAKLISTLAKQNQKILIASYTHTAVDNLSLKLAEQGINFIRIGQTTSIHEDILRYSLDKIVDEVDSIDNLRNIIDNCHIYASTCLGFNHPLISSQIFDVCIIDEASQINVPTVLGPLSRCKRFILVGDHYQLSPIRKYHSEMNEKQQSLFRILCEAHPHAIITLRTQYRMNNDILQLCNNLVYNLRMRTGSTVVGNRKMKVPHPELINEFDRIHKEWLQLAVQSDPSIVIYNTDKAKLLEKGTRGSKMNSGEAAVVSAIAISLILCGVSPNQIGIISPYRAQVLYIRESLEILLKNSQKYYPLLINNINEIKTQIECHTVDKFQGRDKEIILFSSVKSNTKHSPGVHITDWQRLNVSITRAKSKFILVGSLNTLNNSPFFQKMFSLLKENNFYTLPFEIDQANMKPFDSISKVSSLSED